MAERFDGIWINMGQPRHLYVFLGFFFLPALLAAEQTKTVFNPFTGKLDYITSLSTTSLNSAGLFNSTNTWTAPQNFNSPRASSFTTLNIIGPGDGEIIETIFGSTYTVLASSGIPLTVGHIAVYSSTWGTLGDGGTASGIPGGSAFQVQYASANGTQFSGSSNMTNNGSTVTFSGVYTITETNFSSDTCTGCTFDYTNSTATIPNLLGTTAGGNSVAGMLGEYISSVTATALSFPSTGNFGDLAAIVLTAGDWDVSAVLASQANGATVTTMSVGISSTTGNSSAGLNEGDNLVKSLGPTAATDTFGVIPAVRISLTATFTYYLKFSGGFSIATPKALGRISARRIR